MKKLDWLFLPLIGGAVVVGIWAVVSATVARTLPSPYTTWQESKLYVLQPFEYRGELDQGIGRFTWLSLKLVAKGYAIALLVGTPVGFMLGLSRFFTKAFDPIFRDKRPDIKVFEIGKDKKDDIEKELKKFKKDFDLNTFQVVAQ